MKKAQLLAIVFYFILISLAAQTDYKKYGVDTALGIPSGLMVGDTITSFQGVNQHGDTINLSSLNDGQLMVLIFYRGYWCPVCNRYLSHYSDSLEQITAKNARVIAVTPENYSSIEKTIDKSEIKFDVISDTTGNIMKDFNVDFFVTDFYKNKVMLKLFKSWEGHNNSEEAILPVPATYIINSSGVILWRQFDPNYKNRASVKAILDFLAD